MGLTFLIFAIAKRFMQIRVSPEAELEGLDRPEFGSVCYPDFVLASEAMAPHSTGTAAPVREPQTTAPTGGPNS